MRHLTILLTSLLSLASSANAPKSISMSRALPEIYETYPLHAEQISRMWVHPEIKVVRITVMTPAFRAALSHVRLADVSNFTQTINSPRIGPELPRIFLATTINSTNFPNFFLAQENAPCTGTTKTCVVTVQASGGTHTSLTTALATSTINSDNPNGEAEIVVDQAGYTSDTLTTGQSITYNYCPSNLNNGVWVQSSALSSIPQGTKVGPANDSNMFDVTASGNSASQAITINPGSCNLLISGMHLTMTGAIYGIGIEIGTSGFSNWTASHSYAADTTILPLLNNPGQFMFINSASCTSGLTAAEPNPWNQTVGGTNTDNSCTWTNTIAWPKNIFIDRDHIEPTSYSTWNHIGIGAHGRGIAIVDSRIDNTNYPQSDHCNTFSDTQDIFSIGPGPFNFSNDYLTGASSEIVFFGGVSMPQNGTISSDIELRKDFLWNDSTQLLTAGLKNALEFKEALRVLGDGDVVGWSQANANACGGNQFGNLVDLNPQNQTPNGLSTLDQVADITLINSVFEHSSDWISIHGYASSATGTYPVQGRVRLINDLVSDQNHWLYGISPQSPTTAASISGGTESLTLSSVSGFASDWTANHSYAANAIILPTAGNAGKFPFQTSSACTSGGTEPGTWNQTLNGTQSDGTCTWTNQSVNTNAHIAVIGFSGGDAVFNNTGTFGFGTGLNFTLGGGGVVSFSCGSCTNATASSNGVVGIVGNPTGGMIEISGGESTTNSPFGYIRPGPFYVDIEQDDFFGSTASYGNGNYLTYLSKPIFPCGAGSGSVIPQWTMVGLVSVLDTTELEGDSCSTPNWYTNTPPVTPNFLGHNNVLFNFTQTASPPACANFTGLSFGTCPSGLASSPSTISTALGLNYPTCAAGDTDPSNLLSLTGGSCTITGTFASSGPNIAQIICAEGLSNDALLGCGNTWSVTQRKGWPWVP